MIRVWNLVSRGSQHLGRVAGKILATHLEAVQKFTHKVQGLRSGGKQHLGQVAEEVFALHPAASKKRVTG